MLNKVLSGLYQDVFIKLTEGPGDATRFAADAASDHYDVFSMGGDGTLNEVINGIIPAHEDINFGFIPLGTVNDLARALSIPHSPESAISMLTDATTRKIDIGLLNDRYFVNVAAAGIIPEAVSQVSVRDKTFLGAVAYYLKGLQYINRQTVFHFRIETETGEIIQKASPLIVAMLTDSAGSFDNLLPREYRKKHAIKLCLFHDYEMLLALKQAPKVLAGMSLGPDILRVKLIQKAHISLAPGEELWTNIDGDHGPDFPIDIEILPERLSVFVPKHPKKDQRLPARIRDTCLGRLKKHDPSSK